VITRIALLGAESTGKTQLSLGLAKALRARGHAVHVVPEFLRTWCDQQGRTPEPHEQAFIAHQQAVAVLAHQSGVVISDTSPLMTAVYSHKLFNDESLYEFAFLHQRLFDTTLLTGLDLPWVPDGLQRDGPHVREPVDAAVRHMLGLAGLPYQVVYGTGDQRLENALFCIGRQAPDWAKQLERPEPPTRWSGPCETCGDGDCEHRLFTSLVKG